MCNDPEQRYRFVFNYENSKILSVFKKDITLGDIQELCDKFNITIKYHKKGPTSTLQLNGPIHNNFLSELNKILDDSVSLINTKDTVLITYNIA